MGKRSPPASRPEESRHGSAHLARQLTRAHLWARALGTSTADAEDAAQDALLKAHRSLARFQGRSSFSTWMLAVVRNAVRDACKLRRVQARSVEALALATGGTAPSSPDAEELLERAQARDSVWQAIDLLPAPYRRAVVMFELEGHSYEEIAELEAVSIGTVKSRLSRGRAVLRRLLNAVHT